MNKTAIVILAAGRSRRLGTVKQLLTYQGKSLLQRITESVLAVNDITPMVVIGPQNERIRSGLSSCPITIIENDRADEGLSTSIIKGLTAAMSQQPELDACMFVVCDQPFLDTTLMQEIIDCFQTSDKSIIAAAYANTIGTPMLFHRKYFRELLELKNDEGAKKIVAGYPDDVATVPFTRGETDIDTLEDYERLMNL